MFPADRNACREFRSEEENLHEDHSVSEMAQEVLARQAKALAARTGQTFEGALEVVANSDAGRQLRELADREHRDERAVDWQAKALCERAEERLMHLTSPRTPSLTLQQNATTRGLRATWSGLKARKHAPSTTHSWRRNSPASEDDLPGQELLHVSPVVRHPALLFAPRPTP